MFASFRFYFHITWRSSDQRSQQLHRFKIKLKFNSYRSTSPVIQCYFSVNFVEKGFLLKIYFHGTIWWCEISVVTKIVGHQVTVSLAYIPPVIARHQSPSVWMGIIKITLPPTVRCDKCQLFTDCREINNMIIKLLVIHSSPLWW